MDDLVDELRCWYVPILRGKIKNFATVDQLACIKEVERMMSVDVGREFSNLGGWQSNNLRIGDNPILDRFMVCVQSYVDLISKRFNTPMSIVNYWINVNRQGNSNAYHAHPNSLYSGVVYLDASPDQGRISFYPPNSDSTIFAYHTLEFNSYIDETLSYIFIKPETNRVIFFPSHVHHSVEPNPTNRSRISFAFNMHHRDKFLNKQ